MPSNPGALRYGFQRNDARENDVASRLSPGADLTAGEINMPAVVDPDLLTKRLNATNNEAIPPEHCFGRDLGEMNNKIAFQEGDFLLMQKQVMVSNGHEALFPVRGSVMAYLNGHYIDGAKHGITDAKFARQFKFIGVSKTSWTPPPGMQQSNTISVGIAGAGTTYNNGTTEIFLGDDVEWTLNSIDRATRKQELENQPNLPNRDKTKLGIVLRRRNYESNRYLEDALDKTFEETYASQAYHFTPLIHRDQRAALDDDMRVGVGLRAVACLFAAIGVATAAEYGLVRFTGTPLAADAVRRAGAFDDVAKGHFESVLEALGFGNGVAGQENLIDSVVCRSYRGMLSNQDLVDEGDLTHLLPKRRQQSQYSRLLNEVMDETQAIDRAHSAQQFCSNEFYRTMKMLAMQHNGTTALMALNHSLPASRLSYLLRIH